MLRFITYAILGSFAQLVSGEECKGFGAAGHHKNILDNYVGFWGGDFSKTESTLSPSLSLQIDRFPTGTHGSRVIGPLIDSATAFKGFVQITRSSFDKYNVFVDKWVGAGEYISLRWRVEAVLGDNFEGLPTNLKSGDMVTYNGTDFLTLDSCSGLIKEVNNAQDLVTFMYNLGNDISLTPLKTGKEAKGEKEEL